MCVGHVITYIYEQQKKLWIYEYIYITYFEDLFRSSFYVRPDKLANIVSAVVVPMFLPQNPLLREKRSGELKACMVLIELYIYINVASTYFVCDYIQWRFTMFHVVFLNETFPNTAPNKIKN